MALVLVFLQAISGLLLLFQYSPEMSKAYDSIRVIQNQVIFGKLIRNLHHWGANFLIIIVFLHMLRVFFTGAYGGLRNVNWWIGLGLFLCVVISNFTGYLLPFDQLSYWAITISIGMFDYIPLVGPHIREMIIGGPDVNQSTLSNFYAAHIALIPILLTILLPFHFWRVRKAGGVVLPFKTDKNSEGRTNKVPTDPFLITREVSAALLITALLLLVSVLFNAPLTGSANTGMSPNPAKAPWYFSGLQELLQHFHPTFAVFVIPLFLSVLIVLLPYIKQSHDTDGIWFISAKGRKTGLISAVCALILVPFIIIISENIFQPSLVFPGFPLIITDGLIPFLCLLAFIAGLYVYVNKYQTASRTETVQAVSIFILVSFVVLTIVGYWFRGQGMALCWPWDMTMSEIALTK